MSDEELSVVLDNTRYLSGVAVSGYNSMRENNFSSNSLEYATNIEKSNTMTFINIEDQPGNMLGRLV